MCVCVCVVVVVVRVYVCVCGGGGGEGVYFTYQYHNSVVLPLLASRFSFLSFSSPLISLIIEPPLPHLFHRTCHLG